MGKQRHTEKLVFISMLVALSIVLSFIDRQLSVLLMVQGARIGLANIVILTGIYYLDKREAVLLIILKSFISGLLLGTMTAFLIGLAGSVLSFIVMFTMLHYGEKLFSLIGISISGSIAHNIGQMIVLVLFYNWSIVFSLFWLIPIGIGTGFFIGSVFTFLKSYLDKGQVFKNVVNKEVDISELIQEDDL
jgi:heptaprenyl diphosphate synthase